jgi:hypothetical protein
MQSDGRLATAALVAEVIYETVYGAGCSAGWPAAMAVADKMMKNLIR